MKDDYISVIIIYGERGYNNLNILFWNTDKLKAKNNINGCLSELISAKDCDIVILAEYTDNIRPLCGLINILSKDEYMPIPNNGGCEKIKGLIKKKYNIEVIREQNRYQIVMIRTTFYKLIVAMIHNISKLTSSKDEQAENLRIFHQDICAEEKTHQTKNSIIIGDLNVNPFEPACIAANLLHAIPFIEEVTNPTRIVQGKIYQKFYNPMWKFYGNQKMPYTSYYHDNSGKHINYYWNAYDQVVIRPELINAFEDDLLSIITETANHKLLKNNKPDKENYSDHLPLFCTLKEEKI